MEDPYDRAHKLELQNQKKDKSLEGEVSFKPNNFSPKLLNSDKIVIG